MKKLLSLFVLAATSVGCLGDDLRVQDAWVRAAPDGSALGAAYFKIVNRGPATELVAVSSDAHAAASVHETVVRDGVARMQSRARLPVGSGESLVFAPGGLHVMLMRPTRGLREGDSIVLTLTFSNQRSLRVDTVIRGTPP